MTAKTNIRYRVGADVGLNSLGFSAIQLDANGNPTALLKTLSYIHDGGVDPTQNKSGTTRKAVAGIARRTRNMRKRRRHRLSQLDRQLYQLGYPVDDVPESEHGLYEYWNVRSALATAYVPDKDRRDRMMVMAIRHIARHRGWRNSYSRVETLFEDVEPSDQYKALKQRVETRLGMKLDEDMTPAQLVALTLSDRDENFMRVRTSTKYGEGVLPSRLMQSDNARELRRIFTVQQVPEDVWKPILRTVFHCVSPKGSAEKHVGTDPLDQTQKRALKASLAFQKYRILNVITNLRIRRKSEASRPLTVSEKQDVYELLTTAKEDLEWLDVCAVLDIERNELKGVGTLTHDGEERIGNKPPVLDTVIRLHGIKNTKLRKMMDAWWNAATEDEQAAMIRLLSNTVDLDKVRDLIEYASPIEFIDGLDEDLLTPLDSISLPVGRAAYSEKTLDRLSKRMLETEDDLHYAIRHEFDVPADWKPPVPPVQEPTGNPAVDRVLKAFNRFLSQCEQEYGIPESVSIETTKESFSSIAFGRTLDYERRQRRDKDNQMRAAIREDMRKQLSNGGSFKVHDYDIRRWEIVQSQNNTCLYCGATSPRFSFDKSELDHIVPRRGVGSDSKRTNMAAVCPECNASKSNVPFAVWVHSDYAREHGITMNDVIARVNQLMFPPSMNRKQVGQVKKSIISRLKQTEQDEPLDNRSIESVGWMADELHRRLGGRYANKQVKVFTFPGSITYEARRASGIDGQIHFIGAQWKTRLDRRHHAVDASVIAMMNQSVALRLAERHYLRESQCLCGTPFGQADWKQYPNKNTPGYVRYQQWSEQMKSLLHLLNKGLDEDTIPVVRSRRLRLGNSTAHDATVKPLQYVRLGDALSPTFIDHAITPQVWKALTRLPDYNPQTGLPANPNRVITALGEVCHAKDEIGFLPGNNAQLYVNGGAADIGGTIHHARIYRCEQVLKSGKRKTFYGMVRVFQCDLMKHKKNTDLFRTPLRPADVSLRYADGKVRESILSGNATCIAQLTVNDEIRLTPEVMEDTCPEYSRIFHTDSGVERRFTVLGFPTSTKIRLAPSVISEEGLDKLKEQGVEIPVKVEKMFKLHTYTPAISKIGSLLEC